MKTLNSTPAEIGTFITQSEPIIVNQQLLKQREQLAIE